jgi:hypothetical protein
LPSLTTVGFIFAGVLLAFATASPDRHSARANAAERSVVADSGAPAVGGVFQAVGWLSAMIAVRGA